jgi:putative glutathione S-transferase
LDDDPVEAGRWEFNPTRVATLTNTTLPECTYETATGKNLRLAKEIYGLQGLAETSVPILYDKQLKVIVNNESAEIIRMMSTHQEALRGGTITITTTTTTTTATLAPEKWVAGDAAKQQELDHWNNLIYTAINNGAYKAGFSSSQEVYAGAFTAYFDALQKLEDHLAKEGHGPWILGAELTEVDLRLFPTIYRHDPVYYIRMKLNGAKILDYPHLWRWVCRFYALPGVASSGSSLLHCRQGYFGRSWNNVVPLGPLKPMPYPEAYRHPELAAGGVAGATNI